MDRQPDVAITLSGDAALVLDAALAAAVETRTRFDRPAEAAAILELEGALERQLVATFAPNYGELLEAARERLAGSIAYAENPPTPQTRARATPNEDAWQCCFCGDALDDAADVLDLTIHGAPPETQQLRSHRRCVLRALHPSVPLIPASD
jgi:hypothetical protein